MIIPFKRVILEIKMKKILLKTIVCAILSLPLVAAAQTVGLAGILGKKAILVIDGGNPKSVAVGERIHGVKLISVEEKSAVVEKKGKRITLRVGQNASLADKGVSHSDAIILNADSNGHYFADGAVNGNAVRFLLDTGATAVVFGASDAKRLGISLIGAQSGISRTANGEVQTKMVRISLNVGGIMLDNIEAHVLVGESPHALLGMSALRRFNMNQTGNVLTLTLR